MSFAYGARLSRQHEKRRLERVLRQVLVVQDPPANAEHHWPVPLHQGRERYLIALFHKRSEQIPIALPIRLLRGDERAEIVKDRWHETFRHGDPPPAPLTISLS